MCSENTSLGFGNPVIQTCDLRLHDRTLLTTVPVGTTTASQVSHVANPGEQTETETYR